MIGMAQPSERIRVCSMALTITPFTGLRYRSQALADLASIMTPPYDVVSADERAAYLAQNPYNMMHLILGAEQASDTEADNRFTRAAVSLQQWRQSGVLQAEPHPALYLYQQDFRLAERLMTRTGFIGRVRLADYQEGVIFPHEQTFAGPKADLLRLWQACQANLSLIFGVYLDASHTLEATFAAIQNRPPDVVVPHWGEGAHRLWVITQPAMIEQVQDAMQDKAMVIADGHHRYETALALREAMRRSHPAHATVTPYEAVMMFCANLYDPGVVALPTHRLLHGLPAARLGETLQRIPWLQVEIDHRLSGDEPLRDWQQRLEQVLRQRQAQGSVFALYGGGGLCYLVSVPASVALQQVQVEGVSEAWKQLDVSVLHHALLPALQSALAAESPRITYARQHDEVLQAVTDGQAALAVLMTATPLEAMATIAMGGERMPPKSTYFYPKLPTGLVMNPFTT